MAQDNVTPLRPPKPCPICGKPSQRAFHPFCSQRCADVDLNRWLTNSYVVPGSGNDNAEEPDGVPELPDEWDD